MPNKEQNNQVGLTLASQWTMNVWRSQLTAFYRSSQAPKILGLCIAFGLSLGSLSPAFAQMATASAGSLNVTAAKAQSTSSLNSVNGPSFLTLGIADDSFVASPDELNGVSNFTSFSLGLHPQYTSDSFTTALDARASFTPNVPNYSAYQVPQAYLGVGNVGQQNGVSLIVGRKTEEWSDLDERWKLGLVQPTFHWNPLHPVEQGLTGAFVNVKADHFKLILFASDIYIPSQGPSMSLQDGHFTSANPYASPPPTTLVTSTAPDAKQTNIQYNLDMPSTSSVISHPSGGAIVELSEDPKKGFWIRGSYLDAPRNDLSLPIEGHLQIAPDGVYAPITIEPQVIYHQVASVEGGYRSRIFSFSVDALSDNPEQQNLSSDYTYQVLSNQILVSPTLTVNTAPSYYWNPKLTFSYLKQFGGETLDQGAFAAQNTNIFADPMIFHEALMFGVDSTVYKHAGQRVDLSLQTIEELEEQGTVVLAEGRYHPAYNWSVSLGTDILTSQAPESAQTFISRFRGNDLVYAGLEYAF